MKQKWMSDSDIIVPPNEDLNFGYLNESLILNHLPIGVCVFNSAGAIINYNNKAKELWGHTPARGDSAVQFLQMVKMYRTDGELMGAGEIPVLASLKDGIPRNNQEVIIERKDHSRVVVSININLIRDDQGKIRGAVSCFSDISMQKKFQNELHRKTIELEDYVNNAPIGLHWVDGDGIIKWANQAELDLLGYSHNEYIGHHISEFHTDQEKIDDILNRLGCNQTLRNYESVMRCKDGSTRTVQINSNVLWEDGKFVHTRCFTIDVTEAKNSVRAREESEQKLRELTAELEAKIKANTDDLIRKNEELKRSEERYHKMIDEVEDYAIILLDKDGIIRNWNRGAEKIKGYKESEIIGKSFEIFYTVADQQMGLPTKLISLARQTGKALHEGWRVRKDKTRFWGSIVLTALHDVHGNIIGFSKVTRDLTEKKLAEDKLKEYTIELEFQNKELEQFAYAASHDMKEPLRKIHFYNSYLYENSFQVLDDKSKEYLNRSVNAVKRMSDLIEDLLTYSKTTSNLESFEMVDVNEVVEEIIFNHKEELEQKKAQISYDALPNIRFVPFQFKQLMENIISNAMKYKHPDRDLLIRITSQVAKGGEILDKDAEPHRDYHKITVTDNGIGFEPQYADRIFEIFQRLNNLQGAKGSGIGLAICKKVMQNHKGFIKAAGKVDEGARFDIYIPV